MSRIERPLAYLMLALIGLPGGAGAAGDPTGGQAPRAQAPTLIAQSEAEPKRAPKLPPGTKVSVEWTDMDLEELTKRIAEMTGRNFILGERMEGKKVSIFAPNRVTVEDAWQIYLSALRTAGYTVVPAGGDTLKIVKREEAASEPIDTVTGTVVRDGQTYITRLIRLENIPVDDITKALSKLVASEGSMVSYQPNNTLILTDTEANITRLMEIISKLDVEAPREMLEVLEIEYAAASEIAEIIRQVYGEEGASGRSGSTTRTSTRTRRTRQDASGGNTTDVEGGASISKIIPDERTNTIIILATEKALEDIRELVSRLDYEVDPLLKSDIHVVFLEHAKAEELATTLSNLTSDAGRSTTPRTSTTRRTTTGGTTANRTSAAAGSEGTVATFEGGVKVTADESTNALVITASYNDFIILKRVIDKLDVRRRQVFVEGVILELSQDRQSSLGISFHGGLPVGDEGLFLGARGSESILPSLTSETLAGAALGVFGATIPVSLGSLAALTGSDTVDIPAFGIFLQALQNDQEVNILSTPQIMTLNNKEAEIVVGENVPFVTGSTITGTGIQTTNITREDVALKLKVKPQVNEGDEVTLEIAQEITEVVAGTSNSVTGPTTTKRSATTTVSVPDNQTVVIGGLISSKLTTAEKKVPILGDIPVIGVLFRTSGKTERKSNLLIFLTPHVIDSPEDLQDVYRIKMLQRQEFIRRFYGKTREEQLQELNTLLQYSMNLPGYESVYPEHPPRDLGPDTVTGDLDDTMVPRYGSHRGSFAGSGGSSEVPPDVELPEDGVPEDVLPEDELPLEDLPEEAPLDDGGAPDQQGDEPMDEEGEPTPQP